MLIWSGNSIFQIMTQSERMKFMMNNNKLIICLKNEHFKGFGPLSLQVLQKFLTPHFTYCHFFALSFSIAYV
jgi:hypothetical protein